VSTPPGILPSSFRDPRGFVFRADDVLFRQVNEAHRRDFEAMVSSGLYDVLVAEHVLIPHEDVSRDLAVTPAAYRIVRPQIVPFVSYPYEWSFSAWRDAALVTLRAQELAMAHGMSLRDASAYNVQFVHGRPILIDTLSFEVLNADRPWVAYRQFCEHFLGPLALMSSRDVRLGRTVSTFLDGIPLDLAASLLPAGARSRPSLQMHLRLHARTRSRRTAPDRSSARRPFSLRAFQAIVASLRKAVEGLDAPRGPSAWSSYYDEVDHYPPEAVSDKGAFVRRTIEHLRPAAVWDLGANTGRFARLAAERGIDTVAFDVDAMATDASYRAMRADGLRHFLPLVMDLTNPSPAIGWAERERMSLFERGPADLVLALALVHHLAIAGNVPLDRVADVLAKLGRHVVLEWVPKSDPKVREMLRTRDDVFSDHTEGALERALERSFILEDRLPLRGTERAMYLLRRR
jgi:hypothetical protein